MYKIELKLLDQKFTGKFDNILDALDYAKILEDEISLQLADYDTDIQKYEIDQNFDNQHIEGFVINYTATIFGLPATLATIKFLHITKKYLEIFSEILD